MLQPYLSASVKVKESHELARPHDPPGRQHKLTLEFVALYEALGKTRKAAKATKARAGKSA